MSIDANDSGYLNQAAFFTICGSATGTIISTLAATSSDTMKKTAAYGLLAAGGLTATGSAITAWLDPSSKNAKSYLSNVSKHFCYGAPAMATAIAKTVFEAALTGVSKAIQNVIQLKIEEAFLPKPKKTS